MRWPKVKRDGVLFTVGLGLLVREAIAEETQRPYFLLAYLTMMGLPVFLGLDEKGKPKLPDLKKIAAKLLEDEPTVPPAAVEPEGTGTQ